MHETDKPEAAETAIQYTAWGNSFLSGILVIGCIKTNTKYYA